MTLVMKEVHVAERGRGKGRKKERGGDDGGREPSQIARSPLFRDPVLNTLLDSVQV